MSNGDTVWQLGLALNIGHLSFIRNAYLRFKRLAQKAHNDIADSKVSDQWIWTQNIGMGPMFPMREGERK